MNHIFRLVWSHVLNGWVAVAENTRGRGKGSSRKLVAAAAAAAAVALGSLSAGGARAAPVAGQVTSGVASIAQNGALTTITQTSPNLALNWKSFNVAAQETVNFVQPSAAAIAVNRISDTSGSQILGHLNANGQVYLVNPNGILFGVGAQVNVGGLVASTLDVSDASLGSNKRAFSGSGPGRISNQGVINAASGGYVALLGNQVSNTGTITAQLGSVVLGAGSAATLNFSGNSLVSLQVDQNLLSALTENGGLIEADGGIVVMAAGAKDALVASVVNNTGVVQARTVQSHEGSITLLGGMTAGTTNVAGTLDASAPNGGNGGFIETSAAHVKIANESSISTLGIGTGSNNKSGTWLIDPIDFTIAPSGGNMTGSTLSNQLAQNNIFVNAFAYGSPGDINVNDSISWSANTTLSLWSQQNININVAMNLTNLAKLDMRYGQSTSSGSGFYINYAAPVNIENGGKYTRRQGNAGVLQDFTIVNSLGSNFNDSTAHTLQGISYNLTGSFALGSNIDALPTTNWEYEGVGYLGSVNGYLGFSSIGSNQANPFTGNFDGLGHTISALHIDTTQIRGLFGSTGPTSTIANVGLINAKIIGGNNVGALVGYSQGSISNAYSSGLIIANTNVSNTGVNIGGLVGEMASGSITRSYSSATVVGIAGVGGLVGGMDSTSGSILNSYSTGAVQGTSITVGGLIGNINGNVDGSYSTATTRTSASTSGYGGGLIGGGSGFRVTNSYWNTLFTPGETADGSRGTALTWDQMKLAASYSAGFNSNNSWSFYDGLANPLLSTFLRPLVVTANADSKTYDAAPYSGGNGVAYTLSGISVTPETTALTGSVTYGGASQGAINAGTYGISLGGLSTSMQQGGYAITYNNANLTINPATLSYIAPNYSRSYGSNNQYFTGYISGFQGGDNISNSSSGTMVFSSSANVYSPVGSYALNGSGLTANNGNYVFQQLPQNASAYQVKQAPLTVTANTSRIYGDANPTAFTDMISGFVNNETASSVVSGAASWSSTATPASNVGTYSLTGALGNLAASNYTFSIAPGTLTVNPRAINLSATRAYDGSTTMAASLFSLSNYVGNDTLNMSGSGSVASKDASALAETVTTTGLTLVNGTGGGLASNYSLSGGISNAIITPKALTATATAVGKTYDGNTSAVAPILTIVAGLIGNETVSATAIGNFNSKDVATATTVITGVASLMNGSNGGKASNYQLTAGISASASITAKALTATATTYTKTYDGSTTAASQLMNVVASGFVNQETVTATGAGVFNTKDVSSANSVTVNNTVLANGSNGGLASNYSLASGETAASTITAKALTATATAFTKTYDGSTTAASQLMNVVASGLVGSETIIATGAGTYNTKDVATANSVTVNSTALTNGSNGGLASNYRLASGETAASTITTKALMATATAFTKTYDGSTTAASQLMNVVASGLVGSETIIATGAGTFNTKDVATANSVTVNSTTLDNGGNGGLATNYSLASGEMATAVITAKALTAGATASSKVYDGTTTAAQTLAITSGLVGSETVTATGAGTFNTKDVATANTVTVNSTTLANGNNGGLGSNYSLASGETVAAAITAKALTATAAAAGKVYDGKTTATALLTIASGLVGSETVTATGVGTFNTKDVATANTVTVNSTGLANGSNGGVAANYSLASGETAAAAITAKALTANATATGKVYDGTTTAAALLTVASGLVGNETVTATGVGTFNTKDVLTANSVTVNSTTLANGGNGGIATNYSLASGEMAAAAITAKALTAGVTASSKVYDGTTTAAQTLAITSGLVGSETVTATGVGTFNTKDVLTANTVTVNSTTLANGSNGGIATNYSLASGETAAAAITAKALTAGATASSKVYDGTTTAAQTLAITSGLVGSETVTATGAGTFNTKDVATANTVTVNSTTLANGGNGGVASNYSLAPVATVSASITAKALTATATAAGKVYDGSTIAVAPVLTIVSGLVGSETVTATATGNFNTKDVATANVVIAGVGSLTNGSNGGLASNYQLAAGTSASASITTKALTASVVTANKVYDGTTIATPSLTITSGLLNGDTVSATGTGTFNTKDVLTANSVIVNSTKLSNGTGLASNYSLAAGETGAASITPAALKVSALNQAKVFGSADPVLSYTVGTMFGSDTAATVLSGNLRRNAGVNAGLYAINQGTLASINGNYSMAFTAGSLRITPMVLSSAVTPLASFDSQAAVTSVPGAKAGAAYPIVLPVPYEYDASLANNSHFVAAASMTALPEITLVDDVMLIQPDALAP